MPNVTTADAGLYTVVIRNGFGSVTNQGVSVSTADLAMFAGLTINGPIGAQYSIQSTPQLSPPAWTTRTNITLATPAYTYIDYTSPGNSRQFYRAVPLAP